MKQFDSYIIYGCHFSEHLYNIIIKNTNLNFFNSKISSQYCCKIHEFDIPISENASKKKYFLGIIIDQSDMSILELSNLHNINKAGFYNMLEVFNINKREPYLISVPIFRNL